MYLLLINEKGILNSPRHWQRNNIIFGIVGLAIPFKFVAWILLSAQVLLVFGNAHLDMGIWYKIEMYIAWKFKIIDDFIFDNGRNCSVYEGGPDHVEICIQWRAGIKMFML